MYVVPESTTSLLVHFSSRGNPINSHVKNFSGLDHTEQKLNYKEKMKQITIRRSFTEYVLCNLTKFKLLNLHQYNGKHL